MKIKTGDKLPKNDFFYLDDLNEVKKISTFDLFKDQKVIILGMPGAFTKTCSAVHLPGYVKNYDLAQKKGVKKIVCIAVNDPNVMKAWGQNQNVGEKILMVGDPFCKFTKAIGAEVDKSAKGLGIRSNRYTMLLENGVVIKIEQEKETAACKLTAAENFLNGI
ncbi:MAG: peroxiredoxin [Candidatus Marinimicrobia bacterium]|nr:peroxiredoxin [Candidatus Neomarinimicrobiota bacterium]